MTLASNQSRLRPFDSCCWERSRMQSSLVVVVVSRHALTFIVRNRRSSQGEWRQCNALRRHTQCRAETLIVASTWRCEQNECNAMPTWSSWTEQCNCSEIVCLFVVCRRFDVVLPTTQRLRVITSAVFDDTQYKLALVKFVDVWIASIDFVLFGLLFETVCKNPVKAEEKVVGENNNKSADFAHARSPFVRNLCRRWGGCCD